MLFFGECFFLYFMSAGKGFHEYYKPKIVEAASHDYMLLIAMKIHI